MKKIQHYIVKGKEVVIGLEDSKKTWRVCARCEDRIINQTAMPALYSNLRNYIRNNFPECTIKVAYEAGFRGFNLHDKLKEDGIECLVIPPHKIREEKCNKQKSDTTDAREISKNAEEKDCSRCYVPSKENREDRQLSRTLEHIGRDIIREKNCIRRMIEFHGLEEHFEDRAWTDKRYREFDIELKELSISESLKDSFLIIHTVLVKLMKLKELLKKKIEQLATKKNYERQVEILDSVPGVDVLTATRLLLEWVDVSRFDRAVMFACFLGLVPGQYSTGERERKGHITKQGNRWVRRWLIQISWVCIRKDPVMFETYTRIVSNTGSKKKAIVAIARKVAIRMRALLLKDETYELGIIE
ncbi:IS110 family transposase [Methanosarcinales archaeon]|nr:MAG: IS110 family transposase [Methanosarcinales archaeon]